MSNINRKNIMQSSEAIGRFYDEKIQKIIISNIIEDDLIKKGNYLVVRKLPNHHKIYIMKREHDKKILNLYQDEKGFRLDISEQELDNILVVYKDMIKSLQAKISQEFTIEKTLPFEKLKEYAFIFDESVLHFSLKQIDYDYEDYEYL